MAATEPLEGKKLDIVKWALDRFAERGFHATGIDTVMAESGISKRTLYKYFPSKEDLIAAVLSHYGEGLVQELVEPGLGTSERPREQILALFDIRKAMFEKCPSQGCLMIKASQEYSGRHEGLETQARAATLHLQHLFAELSARAGLHNPEELGRQINILFQGAVLLSQVCRDGSPFVSAKAATAALLEAAERPAGQA